MGLHMDDLHAPTVASGPTTGGYSNGVSKAQLSLQELIAEKDRVEAELKALGQVLDSVCILDALHRREPVLTISASTAST
jgi:26S proteasome non-ATPase regulatory subunit 9